MASVNLDTADQLNITCRQGDTFEISLTLKDSSGTGLPLVTDDYKFLMQVKQRGANRRKNIPVRNPLISQRVPLSVGGGGESDDDTSITDGVANTDGIVIGSAEQGVKGPVNFTFSNKDNSGNVTISLSASDMRKVAAGSYVYDLQYIKGDSQKTVLEGSFRVNSDISKAL
jgi:hypothetical protein